LEGKVSQADFDALLGKKIDQVKVLHKGEYTLDCSFQDMQDSFIIRQVIKAIEKTIAKGLGGADPNNPTYKLMVSSAVAIPLKNLSLVSPDSMPRHITTGFVHLANGRILQGLLSMLLRSKS